MAALTVPGVQRLLTTTTSWRTPANQDIEFHLAWSHRRRSAMARLDAAITALDLDCP